MIYTNDPKSGIIAGSSTMHAYWDKNLVCRFALDTYLDWFETEISRLTGSVTMPGLLGKYFAGTEPFVTQVLAGKPTQFVREVKTSKGRVRHALVNYYPDIDAGIVLGFFVHVADITSITKPSAALERSEKRLRKLLDTTPDPLLILDLKGQIEFVNAETLKTFAYQSNELIGQYFEILMPEVGRDSIREKWEEIYTQDRRKAGAVIEFEVDAIDRNKIEFPVEVVIRRIRVDGSFHYSVSIRDITQRKQEEAALSEMAVIIQSTPDAVISNDLDGIIHTWNNGANKILGYSFDEAYGSNIALLLPEYLLGEEEKLLNSILNGDTVAQYETVRQRKDNCLINVSITMSVIRDRAGKIISVSRILRDITDKKRAEAELRESNERNRIFVQQAPNAIAMFDRNMQYIAASRQWIEDYNLNGLEIIGRSHYEIFPEIGEEWKQIHKECMAGAVNRQRDVRFERADGSVQWLEWDVRPWYIADGEIGGILMYTGNRTEYIESEQENRKTQYILEKSNRIANIATWEVDEKTSSVLWSDIANDIFELPFGFQPGPGTLTTFLKDGEDVKRLRSSVALARQHGTSYDLEAEIITALGNSKWIRIIGEADLVNGVCIRRYGIFQDITRVKEEEARILHANDELQALLNSGNVSIVSTNTRGIITHFNHGAEKLLGYSASEMVGKSTPAVIHLPAEINKRGSELSELLGKEVSGIEVFVELARSGQIESREWTYVRKDGSYFPVQLVMSAIKNMDGVITGFLGIGVDISELKKAENETKILLELTMDQNERLKNFAHIVSHNLRSHSGNISMLIKLFVEDHSDLAENEYIEMLSKSAENLRETIANLNEVVKMNTATSDKFVGINLYERVVLAVNNVSQLAATASMEIRNEIDKELVVNGLPAYVDSILLNLITNSIKYRARNRNPTVSLTAMKRKGYVVLSVTDNGLGINLKEYHAKIFGMYQTFHENEDARGIGLFITKNQVESMGGKIEVESEPDVYTTFKISLKNDNN